ncbi:MAG: 4-hydroxythreonine-4-phosphate dehydrogenase PdxA [Devosia sp.]
MNPTGGKPLAISMGEPAGIGPDLILRLYAERQQHGLPAFIVYGHLDFLKARAQRLGFDIALIATGPEAAAETFPNALPVADIAGLVPDKPGDSTPLSANVVVEAISQATFATLRGSCRGVVTAPIQKSVLYTAGFRHPGHTEFLAALCWPDQPQRQSVMMLAHDELRVVPLTVHVPLLSVPGLVTAELIGATCRTVAHDLRTRFGIETPRLAITGLNPHAGEDGTMGTEEQRIIGPAIVNLQREGLDVSGPLPADTLFHLPRWRQFDAVIAMYHDQALIPIKTVAFDAAVNITLGLPIVRTSPDHGTAFDLAGTGKGSSASMLAAIRMAHRLTA